MTSSRRHFLQTSLAVGAGAAAAGIPQNAQAIEPIRRTGKPLMRLSLAAYSFRHVLDFRKKKAEMTLSGFIDYAAGLPLDAVELTGYYFTETTPQYLARLKGQCTRLGLDVS